MISIIIADDHQMFRQGLKLLLQGDSRFQLLGEAGNGSEVLRMIRELAPDVVLLDLAMPRPDGVEVITELVATGSATKCLILTMKEDILSVRRALQAGARGYLLKGEAFDRLAEAIVAVAGGRLYLGDLRDNPELFANGTATRLTQREEEILELVADGLSSKQIAEKLHISARTVETHRQNLMQKFGCSSTHQLVKHAREHGLC